ncbi:response regulator transcription factor [Leptothoe sp. PORK10 BA2]|uniref:response regulator transcription factor n=1 Tax=Leptothoe sp. PORK10 BA2 TaxID=3110254 RepID=UPI002B217E80|nr:response regulator [Leptothoe sp. PORK10 BA2]MEA5466833.1 response regulator [Leptothoe sp. PORK10 BA2]
MYQILIVEDEIHLAAFVAKGFRKHGYIPTVVNDGAQALVALEDKHYDAVLLDLGLPVKDGWTVLRELRERGDTPPVIVMTALNDVSQAVLAAKANDFLQKPFRFKMLLESVQNLIQADPSAPTSGK